MINELQRPTKKREEKKSTLSTIETNPQEVENKTLILKKREAIHLRIKTTQRTNK